MPETFWPGVVLPGAFFVLLYTWPFLEARVTHDRRAHHLLDRPRNRPVRTAIGIGAITFLLVLLLAGGQDVVAELTRTPVTDVNTTLQVLALTLPFVIAAITWKWCHDLLAADARRHPDASAPDRTPPAPHGPADRRRDDRPGPVRHAFGAATGAALLAGLVAVGRRLRGRSRDAGRPPGRTPPRAD